MPPLSDTEQFDKVNQLLTAWINRYKDTPGTRLQHDYFAAYLAMIRQEPQQAHDIVAKYAEHPVDRWRDLFGAMLAQLDEIDSARRGSPDNCCKHLDLA